MFTLAHSKVVWIASLVVAIGTHSAWGQPYAQPKGMKQPHKIHSQPAQAPQDYQNPNAPPQKQQQQQLSGTIDQIGSHGMVVEANGQKWNVAPDKNCKIEVTGSGDASVLKPGMLVRFSGEADKKGTVSAPVAELEVTSPQNLMAPDHMQAHYQSPTGGSRTTAKKAPAPPASGAAAVVGHLKSISGNEITVDSPSGPIKAELSPSASVKIDSSDPKLAQVGAKIEVQGVVVKQPNVVAAHAIRITLGGPAGDKKSAAKPHEKPGATN